MVYFICISIGLFLYFVILFTMGMVGRGWFLFPKDKSERAPRR